MSIYRISYFIENLLFAHILNPLWHSRLRRRKDRQAATAKVIERMCSRLHILDDPQVDFPGKALKENEGEHAFAIWFQGEENAPALVKACFRSLRANSDLPVKILNESEISEWIELPDFIMKNRSKMTLAHFSDICRVELVYQYGGLWLDATDFIPNRISKEIMEQPFFVYLAGKKFTEYSFMQNCFIRSERHNPLLGKWRAAIYKFWQLEGSVPDYFTHQIIFKYLIEHDPEAKELFDRMPHMVQDPTHVLWFGYKDKPFDEETYRKICSEGAFQKTDHKSITATNPIPGSFAEHIINYHS